MKRFLFVAACASLTLAGCVNDERLDTNEVLRKEAKKVTFSAPVVGANSRAVLGEINTYPTNETFNVYAVRHSGTFDGWDTHVQENNGYFMQNKIIGYNQETNCWESSDDYYWPIGKYVTFGAYSPTQLDTDFEVGYNESGLFITNYQIPAVGSQYDVMFSNLAIGKNADSGNSEADYAGVDLLFNHALSSIKFTAKVSGNFEVWINKIEICNVAYKGNFTQGINSHDGTPTQQTFGNPVWTPENDLTNYVVYEKPAGAEKGIKLTADDQTLAENVLLLPQNFPALPAESDDVEQVEDEEVDDGYAKIKVYYQVGSNVENHVQKHIFPLSPFWAMGVRYVYNINIGGSGSIKKITFAPMVEPWKQTGGGTIGL